MLSTAASVHSRMAMSLSTEVRMIKGVGPQRAELLAQRGIHTLEDLLGYLPFRYEDRIHFSKVKDIQPNGVYTIRARVMSGQAVRTMRGRDVPLYSCLSAAIGSIRLALRAGIQQASVATTNRIAGTPMKTGRLTTPFVIARTEITSASTHPIAAPQVITPRFSRIICRTTRPLVAPNASRTPISLVRLATAYETTA